MIVYKQVNQGLIFVECYIYDPIFSKYRCIASEVVTVMAVSGPISPFVASIFDKVYVKNMYGTRVRGVSFTKWKITEMFLMQDSM